MPKHSMSQLTLRTLQVETVGRHLDLVLTGRALVRTSASLGWLALALAFAGGWAWLWGLPLLAGAVASWRHVTSDARRPGLGGGRVGRGRSRVSPPSLFDGARLVELVGLVTAAAATGHLVAAFGTPLAALLATGLVLVSAVPSMANLVAHRSYARFPGAPAHAVPRRLAGVVAGTAAAVLLWPAQATGPAVALVVSGALFLAAASLWSAVWFDRSLEVVEAGIETAYRAAVKDIFLTLHNDLRNPARGVLDAVLLELAAAEALDDALEALDADEHPAFREWQDADETTRQLTIGLARRVSEFVEMTREGGSALPRRAADVVDALLKFHSGAPVRYRGCVLSQLDPETLTTLDIDLVALSLTELVTNAVTARARTLEVDVAAPTDTEGRTWVVVGVTCDCGGELAPGRPDSGTLGLLAERLEALNGGLSVEVRRPGVHTTTARWPTDASPRELPVTACSARRNRRPTRVGR